MPYNYSDQYLTERIGSGGKDPGRGATARDLAARAKAGDQAALMQLIDLSGGPGDPHPDNNWATEDAKNYGKMQLRDVLPGYQPDYGKAHDGSFSLGHALGSVLKVAAPIAGALIPGVGWLGGAAIGALGNSGGQLLSGGKFNFGQALMSGALAGGGNAALGNGLGSGSSGMFGAARPFTAPLQAAAGQLGPQGIMAPGGGTIGAVGGGASGGGGILGQAGKFLGGSNGFGLDDILKYGTMIGGGISATNAQNKANQERDAAIAGAQGEWNSRAPLRTAAQQQLLGLSSLKAPDFTQMFADPGNPFYRPPLAAGAA